MEMKKITELFEKVISYALLTIAMLYVLYETLQLIIHFGGVLYSAFQEGTFTPSNRSGHLDSLFFNILLSLEIIETIRVFSHKHISKIRIILLVGLIAVTRKILMLDGQHAEPVVEVATAIMLVALGITYFLVTRNNDKESET